MCHYCTFAQPPRRGERAYLTIEEVLEIARAGAAAGCREALFTLGDKPELRYRAARDDLAALGCGTTIEYLARAAEAVLTETEQQFAELTTALADLTAKRNQLEAGVRTLPNTLMSTPTSANTATAR